MGVTTERNRNKIIRAVTLGINLIHDENLWKFFSDNPVGSTTEEEDKFCKLMIFELALAKTVGTDTKNYRFLKEEPLKSAVFHAVSCDDISINDLIVTLKSHSDILRLNPSAMVGMYKEVIDDYVPRRFFYAITILAVVVKRLRELFDKDEKITPEVIESFTRRSRELLEEEMEKDDIGWFCEMTGAGEEKANEVINRVRKTLEKIRSGEESSAGDIGSDTSGQEE